MNTNPNTNPGRIVTLWALLTLVLCALKLTGYLAWSWWWIAAIAFGPVVFCVAVVVAVFAIVIAGGGDDWSEDYE